MNKSSILTFENDGEDFSAYRNATRYLNSNGYSFGSMCRDEPIGVMKGNYCIAKWRNLSTNEKNSLDGRMISKDFRYDSVTVEFQEHVELL